MINKTRRINYLVFTILIGLGFSLKCNAMDSLLIDVEELNIRNQKFEQELDRLRLNSREFRSGDIIGNGGGLYETKANFYLQSLNRHILSAFEQDIININNEERETLKLILQRLTNREFKAKIMFLYHNDSLEFFKDELDPAPRVAKTGFSPKFPIFINGRAINEVQNSTIDEAFWIGLLIHELGHQVGIASHTFLDSLGAKVSTVTKINMTSLSERISPQQRIELKYTDHNHTEGNPDLTITFGDKFYPISSLNQKGIRELCGKELIYTGMRLGNLHWQEKTYYYGEDLVVLNSGMWVELNCLSPKVGIFQTMRLNISLKISIYRGSLKYELEF